MSKYYCEKCKKEMETVRMVEADESTRVFWHKDGTADDCKPVLSEKIEKRIEEIITKWVRAGEHLGHTDSMRESFAAREISTEIATELWQHIVELREALSQTVDEANRDYKFKAITAQEALTASKAKFGESED